MRSIFFKKKLLIFYFNYYGATRFICISCHSNCCEFIPSFYYLISFNIHTSKITISNFYSKRFIISYYEISFNHIESNVNNSLVYTENNIALISRGYDSDPAKTSPLLINAFLDVLKAKALPYLVPAVNRGLLRRLAYAVLPSADIRRDYVIDMATSRWQLLVYGIGGVESTR